MITYQEKLNYEKYIIELEQTKIKLFNKLTELLKEINFTN